MRYVLTKTHHSSQEQTIRDLGDQVWEALCDNFTDQEVLKKSKILADYTFLRESGLINYSPSTRAQYLACIMHNVAEMEGSSLRCVGRGIFQWVRPDEANESTPANHI